LGRTGDALYQRPALDMQLGALLRAEVGDAETERIARRPRCGRLAIRCARLAIGLHLADRDGQVMILATAPDANVGLRSGRGAADDAREVARALDLAAIETDDDVADLDPGLLGRPARLDATHQGASGLRQAQRFGHPPGHLRDPHADAPAHDPAARLELFGDAHRRVDRDREGDSHEAAGPAVDLRVDADDLALHVDQGPARIPGIDGHVGLDERQVFP